MSVIFENVLKIENISLWNIYCSGDKAPNVCELLVENQQVTISATTLNINLGQIEHKKITITTSVVPEEDNSTLVATGEWT